MDNFSSAPPTPTFKEGAQVFFRQGNPQRDDFKPTYGRIEEVNALDPKVAAPKFTYDVRLWDGSIQYCVAEDALDSDNT